MASSAGGVISTAFSEFSVPNKNDLTVASATDGELFCNSFMKASQRKNYVGKAEMDRGAESSSTKRGLKDDFRKALSFH
ncbi:hypothetical protein BDD14_2303 [Edaphobacter modestus]|uniref:Uncharacterized protein n=1 Tax=Edaphobacter modestus TaxID=388466 RepID=A0A4Q7YSU1_9BACT|nr:hypothetical protein BDD14_2303 [Edaphobacter modestus]